MKSIKSAEKQIVSGRKLFAGISDGKTVITRSRQLSGSHFLVLVALKSQEARQFYAQRDIEETPGLRDLRKQIADKAFERTGMPTSGPDRMKIFRSIPLRIFICLIFPDCRTAARKKKIHPSFREAKNTLSIRKYYKKLKENAEKGSPYFNCRRR